MATNTITVRADAEIADALDELMSDGGTRSSVVRAAILAAARKHRRVRLRAEAERLAADPEDAAEMRAVREDMESLRAW